MASWIYRSSIELGSVNFSSLIIGFEEILGSESEGAIFVAISDKG